MQRACVICGQPSPQSRCPTHKQTPLNSTPGWKAKRLTILERDNWACQFPNGQGGTCGQPANHVDHITPRSQGGTHHDDDLLRAACAHHNIGRSNRAA